MKNFLPIIITFVVTAILSSGITYFLITEKYDISPDEKGSSQSEKADNGNSSKSYSLDVIDETVYGSSNENKFEIKSAVLDKDSDGEDVVIVTFIYTRLSGENESLFHVTYNGLQVYQNGVGLSENYGFKTDSANSSRYDEVKIGYSAEIAIAYTLKNKTSDIVVEVQDYYSDYVVSKTFKIQ